MLTNRVQKYLTGNTHACDPPLFPVFKRLGYNVTVCEWNKAWKSAEPSTHGQA